MTHKQLDAEMHETTARDEASEARRERNRREREARKREARSEKWGEAQLVQRESSDGGRLATQPSASSPDLLG